MYISIYDLEKVEETQPDLFTTFYTMCSYHAILGKRCKLGQDKKCIYVIIISTMKSNSMVYFNSESYTHYECPLCKERDEPWCKCEGQNYGLT